MKKPTDIDVFTMTRRWFLGGLMALAVTAAWPNRWRHYSGESLDSHLLRHFFPRERAFAARIGVLYLESVPPERSKRRLAEMVLGVGTTDPPFDIAAMTARVRARRDRDFLDGDLVVIDGWLLTRTEARLCALASLSASS